MRLVASSLLLCALVASPARAVDEGGDFSGWVEGKLASMSLKEKIGQMLMVDVRGTELTPDVQSHLKDGAYGNVIFFEWNVQDEDQTQAYIKQLQDFAVVSTGVPMLVAVDQEGGPVNRLGTLLGMKSTKYSARTIGQVFDYDQSRAKSLVGAATERLATRMHQLGFNMNLAPVLDLTGDKESYIYERSYGDDPETVAKIAGQFADVMRAHKVVTTGKHFPNLSVTRPDSHHDLPVLDRRLADLESHELVPFARLKDKLGAVMLGHIVVPDVDPKFPASISYKMGKILRKDVGWKGVVISDDLKMRALADRYTLPEVVLRALSADVDILLMAWGPDKQQETVRILEQCVQRGKIPMQRIDRSVRRILELKEAFAR